MGLGAVGKRWENPKIQGGGRNSALSMEGFSSTSYVLFPAGEAASHSLVPTLFRLHSVLRFFWKV